MFSLFPLFGRSTAGLTPVRIGRIFVYLVILGKLWQIQFACRLVNAPLCKTKLVSNSLL